MLVLRCPKHPHYTGVNKYRKQRDGSVCPDCVALYERTHAQIRKEKVGEANGRTR